MGTRCGFEDVGMSVPSSQFWEMLTFSVGVVAEVWLWSDEKEAKTCCLQQGFVRCGWKREKVVQQGQCKGLSLGSTHTGVEQCRLRELPFVCFILVASLARNGIVYSS